jgi:Uma2 family endonuclease
MQQRKMARMATTTEVIEEPLSSEELGARYRLMCDDPLYANVPGKIELDVWGRILMTPPGVYHGLLQGRVCQRLAALGGATFGEVPIATTAGLFAPDAAWASDEFIRRHRGETPLMRAPELCIEVASPSNSRKELQEKVDAYLAAGAEEVWIVYLESKRWQFYGKQGVLESSRFPVDLGGLFD